MMEEIVYLNGSLLPRSQAKISVYDHGLLYGYALFETMRAYQGNIFLLERHLERLRKSSEIIKLSPKLAQVDLRAACIETLRANKLQDARIRLTVTRGEVEGFPGKPGSGEPAVLVTAKNYQALPEAIYNQGFRAVISSFSRLSQSLLAGIKSSNYLANILARMEAERAGLDEALFLNERGFLTEGTVSNVFFADSRFLVTPPLSSGILTGITREVVIGLAGILGLRVIEENISLKDTPKFREAFLTSSVIEIMPLVGIQTREESITIGQGSPGNITRNLMAAYRQMVERQTNLDNQGKTAGD